MTEFGERVLEALADQGFGLTFTEEEVTVLSLDGKRLHRIPAAYFTRNARGYMEMLIVVVIGLELIEGFVPPQEFRDS